ncbi:MAG: ATP-binding protein, partial [Nitrososphaera sp.]|nr:ATP-binding protein [Nitrososphaera sp.]
IRFPDGVTDRVLSEIESFWLRGDFFKKYGFLHRRGYLFYGPQGSGKSSVVQQIVKDIIDREGVVFLCGTPSNLNKALQTFRQIEPDRQVVCIFEDIDAIVRDSGEDEVLSLLDGENQIDKVLNIATTNYPERLDKRIVARPRRFDRVLRIDMPSDEVRRTYFQHKLPNEPDLENWVTQTKGLSFASLAEAVISVKCLGNTFEETITVLKAMNKANISSEDFKGKPGFASTQ